MPIYNNDILMNALYDADIALNASTDSEVSNEARGRHVYNAIIYYTNFLKELLHIASRINEDRANAVHSINYILFNKNTIQRRIEELMGLSQAQIVTEGSIAESVALQAVWRQCRQMTDQIYNLTEHERQDIHENIVRPYFILIRREADGESLQRSVLKALLDRFVIHLDFLQGKLRFGHTHGTYEDSKREDFEILSEYVPRLLRWSRAANLTDLSEKAIILEESFDVFVHSRQMQEGFRIVQEEGIDERMNAIHLERQAPILARIQQNFNSLRRQLQEKLTVLLAEAYNVGKNLLRGMLNPIEALGKTWEVVTHPIESLNSFLQYCWRHPGRASLYVLGSLAIIGAGVWAGAALVPALGIAATISEAALTATVFGLVVSGVVASLAVIPAGSDGRNAVSTTNRELQNTDADERRAMGEQRAQFIREWGRIGERRAAEVFDRQREAIDAINVANISELNQPEAIQNTLAILDREQVELDRTQKENNEHLATTLAAIRGRNRDISEAERGMLAMQRLLSGRAREAQATTQQHSHETTTKQQSTTHGAQETSHSQHHTTTPSSTSNSTPLSSNQNAMFSFGIRQRQPQQTKDSISTYTDTKKSKK